ncbi:PKD domain-containing protein [Fimbriiglobus ruber]|uniref:PKD domain-containing protein n=1 Tax=Fimbriiglobus ruber TaxID=1908690 RepID=UPI001179AC93|nr:hypothetical protein [Fimbriiglobus ruber]
MPTGTSATIDWGDGMTEDAQVNETSIRGTHEYDSVGSYSVTITVHEADGGNVTTTVAADVEPAPTTESLWNSTLAVDAAMTGNPISMTATESTDSSWQVATFHDASSVTSPYGYNATIEWGDGFESTGQVDAASGAGNFVVYGNHVYTAQGTYSVTAIIEKGDEGKLVLNGTASVAEAPLTAYSAFGSSTYPQYLAQGYPIGASPEFPNDYTDPTVVGFLSAGVFDHGDDFSATVDWGDGTTSNSAQIINWMGYASSNGVSIDYDYRILAPNHAYANDGSYGVTVTAWDNYGHISTSVSYVQVNTLDPVPPAVPPSPPAPPTTPPPSLSVTVNPVSTTAGHAFSGVVASVIDPTGQLNINQLTADINWGDGYGDSYLNLGSGPTTNTTTYSTSMSVVQTGPDAYDIYGGHVYPVSGEYTISVGADDFYVNGPQADEGGSGTAIADVAAETVTDTAWQGQSNQINATQGVMLSNIPLATFSDPDPSLSLQNAVATIYWGDGSYGPGTVTGSAGQYTVTGTHTYSEPGEYFVGVNLDSNTTSTLDSIGTVLTPGLASYPRVTTTAIVSPSSKSLAGVGSQTITAGSDGTAEFDGSLATFDDANLSASSSDYTVTVDWGMVARPVLHSLGHKVATKFKVHTPTIHLDCTPHTCS